ncbi:hypothetical protein [Pelagibius marinus]|uniref:hypothetical protein n=1 Tax=Pelagibius marinus TaxID=2762760 RepID=UPI001872EB20|nr:hypothetical protein [Pelagibius marinus]
MIKRNLLVALLAATLVLQGAAGAWATNKDKDREEDRDGQSRYELAPLAYLPLVFAGAAQERIAKMYFLMQTASYLVEMTTGVKATSQNRVSLGGLFGGVFAKTYSAEDFIESLEVGTVYRAGDGLLAVAMEGDEVLSDHKVIVFNGDYQYDPKALPSLQQVEPAQLQKLQAYSLMVELAHHTLTTPLVNVIARLNHVSADQLTGTPDLTPAHETEIPVLRKLIVGKVYRGPDNTLLVVIPPAIVQDR